MSRVIDAIARRAADGDQSIALSDEKLSFSYASLHAEVQRVANLLRDGLPGDRPVALVADNSCAWVVIDLACVMLGRPLVPLPQFFTAEQRQYALMRTGAAWLISDADNEEMTLEVADKSCSITRLTAQPIALPTGTAKITFTSGTTGAPKGVCLSQFEMESVSASLVDVIGRDKAGVHVPLLPLAVLLENVAGLYSTVLAGGHYRALSQSTIGFAKPFEPDFVRLVGQLSENGVVSAIMVPELLRGTMAVLGRSREALPELKFLAVGGANVSEALLAQAGRLGLPVFQGYGLSEAASVVALNTVEGNRPGSVGKPLPHVKLRLAADREVLIDEPGFLGYVGGPPAPRIYATGDVGFLDSDGYLHVGGRKSNVLITAFGRNVSPEWVESELTAQPSIYQALVFGDGEPELAALIVPSSPTQTPEQLAHAIGAANAKLPEYAKIRSWQVCPAFTLNDGLLTPNGRLQRRAINAKYGATMNRLVKVNRSASFFETLVKETEPQRNYLMASEQLRRGLVGAISVETYREYLGEAYHHVRHTVPLMQHVKSRLPAGREWLTGPLDEYIAEETGHEEWILDDIRNAGGDAEGVRRGQPRMATEFMVSYAYDFISRINPVGFFGMVFVLEGTSTKLATAGAEALMRSLGLGANCFRYLTSHGSLDIEHMKFFEKLMSDIERPDDKDAIIHMAQRMFVLFADMFRSIPLTPAGNDVVI